jgi:DNA-binding MarR family transcriptional regulator
MRAEAPPFDLSLLLNQASYALAHRLGGALRTVGLDTHRYCVLAKAAEGEYTQRQLADRACMDRTTMVTTLDQLESEGLAERRTSAVDRRVHLVGVTPKGKRLLARADRAVTQLYEDILAAAPRRDQEALVRALTHLIDGPLASPFHMEQAPAQRRRRSA